MRRGEVGKTNKHELIVIEYALVKLHTHLLISIDELYGYEGGVDIGRCALLEEVFFKDTALRSLYNKSP